MMSNTEKINGEIRDLEKKIETYTAEQRQVNKSNEEFNRSVTENLKAINVTIGKLDVFQAELNSTNKRVDEHYSEISSVKDEISEVLKTQAVNSEVIKEFKQLKMFFAATVITLILGAIWNANKPDSNAEAIKKLAEVLETNIAEN